MNSSTFPDALTPEYEFRDYMFASKAIDRLKQFHAEKDGRPFMLGIGFKSPHLCMHVPYKYFNMYRDHVPKWRAAAARNILQYPRSSPSVGFSLSINNRFKFMNQEGRFKFNKSVLLPHTRDIAFPTEAYVEAMWGYSAAVSFADAQLGRVLDAIDAADMWQEVVIVVTSDHGMHNGEKGIW